MKCPFCLSESKRTKEHFFSQLCDVFGIDRSTSVGSLHARTGELGHVVPLGERSVRLPCETCNSGWMNVLEHEAAAALGRWITGPEATLTEHEVWVVRRWLANTAIVLAFGEIDARRFIEFPTETAIPDITTAKAVMKGEPLDGVHVGAARTTGSPYIWGVGNPTVTPSGRDQISCRAVNVAALNLGTLQLWAVIPVLRPERVELPAGVLPLRAHFPFGALRFRSGDVDPETVTAFFPGRQARNRIAFG